MKFRKFTPKDHNLVKSLINKSNPQDFSISYVKEDNTILGFSEAGELVALAMQWRNELHHKTIVIEICVLPEKRREGIGTHIFKRLIEEFPAKEGDFAFDIKCESDNIEVRSFAESLGFQLYLSCYNNIFKLEEMKIVKSDLEIINLSEFYKDDQNKDKVKVFHCSMYDRDHEPYMPLNKDQEVRYDYYSDGNPEFGAVLLRDNEIVGCSFAYLGFEEELKEQVSDVIGLHGYASSNTTEEEAHFVQALYSYQICLLKENNHKHVYIEFDSIEEVSDLMLEWLPYTKKPLLRYTSASRPISKIY